LVKQSSQGNFVPEGRCDILIEAIGQPEHCGCVRATGKGARIKYGFKDAPRNSSSSPALETKAELTSKIPQELMEEMRKETEWVRLELRHEFLSQQVYAEPVEAQVSPTPKSTKGSCATPTTSGEDIIGQMSQCELLVEGDIFPQVVAIGKVYQEATTLHNVPLSPYVVKVTMERV